MNRVLHNHEDFDERRRQLRAVVEANEWVWLSEDRQ